jgi:2-dehydro-3-deoxyphosphogluconate aldolase/(4S)-4-hydroxy-2-oxoglutarate aldolase
MDKDAAVKTIIDIGIIAIMRAQISTQLVDAVVAIKQGGARVIEMTMITPSALSVVEEAASRFASEVLLDAGTVLDPQKARAAILAGAEFVVTPTLNLGVIEVCHWYGVLVIPSCVIRPQRC